MVLKPDLGRVSIRVGKPGFFRLKSSDLHHLPFYLRETLKSNIDKDVAALAGSAQSYKAPPERLTGRNCQKVSPLTGYLKEPF